MPKNLSYVEAAAAPLAGLTAYQGLHEELEVQSGKSVFIPGGSGSFGQMAVPIAKAMDLNVIVSGSSEARERILEMGADQYLDYSTENYVDLLLNVDYVIDTLGPKEFDSELSIIKPGEDCSLSVQDQINVLEKTEIFHCGNKCYFPCWRKV